MAHIDYTRQNLPEELNFDNNQKTSYIYLPDGTKRAKKVEDTQGYVTLTEYCGNFIWETIGTSTRSLKYILTPEGRILFDTNGCVDYLEYHLKDHLGNVRVALKDDGTVLQENHYYPFGMEMTGLSSSNTTNKNLYQYNGKELQDDFDLGWYDYGARFYDPPLGRFTTIAPLAGLYFSLTPYNYVGNNPIHRIDPDGRTYYEYVILDQINSDPKTANAHLKTHESGVLAGGMIVLSTISLTSIFSGAAEAFIETMLSPLFGPSGDSDEMPQGLDPVPEEPEPTEMEPYAPERTLENNKRTGNPVVDEEADGTHHTQLGQKKSSRGKKEVYRQGREIDKDGKIIKEVHFTDHDDPEVHPNPHEHNRDPKTGKRGDPEEFNGGN